MHFPSGVLGFYIKNFWRYCGLVVLLYSALAIIDTFGLFVLPAYYLKNTIKTLENTPQPDIMNAIFWVAIAYFVMRGIQWGASILRWYTFDKYIKYPSYNKISTDLYKYVFQQSAEFLPHQCLAK